MDSVGRVRGSLGRALTEVAAECAAQDETRGVQDLPDGTGDAWRRQAETARRDRAAAASEGGPTWRHVLLEAVFAALAERDPQRLRAELVQVAAVAAQWMQALERRGGTVPGSRSRHGGPMEKLVRDRIPEIIESAGGRPDVRVAADGEYRAFLRAKLLEETGEYAAADDPEELADVLEVVYALAAAHGVPAGELDRMRRAKAAERGGFDRRLVLRRPRPRDEEPVHPQRHAVRALILDENDDLVLFRRTKPGREPYFSTPGGKVEPEDSDPEAALRRELDEELGATAGPLRQVFSYFEQGLGLHYLSTFYVCRLISLDLSRRHGPEFDDPAKGAYDVVRVPCTPEALAAIDLFPAPLAAYLQAHAQDLPSLLPR
ncbi:NUDIX domain-containing protein [Thermomonospora amylolytica]|uniref:NUDIX domain-containing protein n=1 Tax=Thermomonospora amylolytica TaxID=1411117 RepID=UPI000E6C5B7E|nr:NUDIX domain-containing protein [Thermomonospora amylolytica]